jgi:MOSC domain-containing protein YiiM
MPKRTSRLFNWLNTWRDDELQGRLDAIYIAEAAAAPMRAVDACTCLAGRGLDGDRYASGAGHWIKTDGCQVTLVTAEDVARATARGPQAFLHGEHRRNLVVSGIPLDAYRHREVRIGQVRFGFHRLRPPCGYLDSLLQPGAGRALGRGAGIALRVLDDGIIRVGDPVVVLETAARRP